MLDANKVYRLDGRVAIVTGGGRGLGEVFCRTFAGAGAAVVVADIIEENARKVADDLTKAGHDALAVRLDVRERAQVEAAVGEVLERWGKLDILVNNAGITRDTLLLRMSDEQWQDVIQTNLTSVFLCTQAAIKPMIKARYGRIISLTSIVGQVGNAGQANYASAKAGIIGFTKTVAKELASRNITANAIAPGFIESPMTEALPDKAKELFLNNIPLKRPGKPIEVAYAALFLASDEAAYITGQVLNVDGGLVM